MHCETFCSLHKREVENEVVWGREQQLLAVTSKQWTLCPQRIAGAGFDWDEQNKPLSAVFCIL